MKVSLGVKCSARILIRGRIDLFLMQRLIWLINISLQKLLNFENLLNLMNLETQLSIFF